MSVKVCATTACGRAAGEGEKFCRKHGGNKLACGICGAVSCPGHHAMPVVELNTAAAAARAGLSDSQWKVWTRKLRLEPVRTYPNPHRAGSTCYVWTDDQVDQVVTARARK